MSGHRITIDGLWRCLCPSVDTNALVRALNSPLRPATTSRHHVPSRATPARRIPRGSRLLHSNTAEESARDASRRKSGRTIPKIPSVHDEPLLSRVSRHNPRYLDHTVFKGESLHAIYDAIYHLRSRSGQRARVLACVNYLLWDCGRDPDPEIFRSLIAAASHRDGSAGELWSLFQWLEELGMVETGPMYRDALLALAIHPDYILRNKLLRGMKAKWLDLQPQDKAYEAIGLLRDGQYELALDKLETLVRDGTAVPDFLFDIFTYAFCSLGFLDEALRITTFRSAGSTGDSRVSLNTWYFLLDHCARNLHHPGTLHVWARTVRTQLLNPSDALCTAVLDTAARAADIGLATEAVQLMAARGTKLNTSHFEALIECYTGAGDISNALQTLCLMRDGGIALSAGSTRAIFAALKNDNSLIEIAVSALFSLRSKFDIPLEAFKVVLESMIAVGDANAAFDFYRHVRALCPDTPDAGIFRMLFTSARNDQDLVFLDREMRAFGITPGKAASTSNPSEKSLDPDARVKQLLLDAHAKHGDLHVALDYLADLTRSGWFDKRGEWLGRETAVALLERCFAERPDPVPWLLREARRRGCGMQREMWRLMESANEEDRKRAEELGIPRLVDEGDGKREGEKWYAAGSG